MSERYSEVQISTEMTARLFDPPPPVMPKQLKDRFGVPPFTILDTKTGPWQQRKQAWIALGLRSEEGRDARSYGTDGATDDVSLKLEALSGGVSIFDPVLTDLMVQWFSAPGDRVLDPFAGGSVRGIVTGTRGRAYTGIDLSGRQIAANNEQADVWPIGMDYRPQWIEGDSYDALGGPDVPTADMVLTCPPYYDLEVYSDDPADLSTMDTDGFNRRYRAIVAAAVERMRPDSFAVWVVGNVRDRKGMIRDLVGLTITAHEDAGADYYNHAILLNRVGTAQLRAPAAFNATRKLTKTHQDVIVFVKGDPKRAADRINAEVQP